MTQMLIAAAATFAACLIAVPLLLALARAFGLYAIVQERRCYVYILFGKVIATIEEPGLHFLFAKMGWRAFVINWLGRRHVLDMRLVRDVPPRSGRLPVPENWPTRLACS